jgi:hypothetical protein
MIDVKAYDVNDMIMIFMMIINHDDYDYHIYLSIISVIIMSFLMIRMDAIRNKVMIRW